MSAMIFSRIEHSAKCTCDGCRQRQELVTAIKLLRDWVDRPLHVADDGTKHLHQRTVAFLRGGV